MPGLAQVMDNEVERTFQWITVDLFFKLDFFTSRNVIDMRSKSSHGKEQMYRSNALKGAERDAINM
jgi:hypothetical protein